MIDVLVRGLAVGFTIAALPPIGPVSLLCIRRTLAEGRTVGLVSGLGAATADATFGLIAGFGLTVLADMLLSHVGWLHLFGGLFLCYLGIRTMLARPTTEPLAVSSRGVVGAYASTLVITLTNPITIIYFASVFAGLGLHLTGNDYRTALLLSLGVFIGSAVWWLLLSGGTHWLRRLMNERAMRWMNRISGGIIIGFGFAILTSEWLFG
ncbi:MAG: LysE family transporter [Chloroflexaceae bacterium]|nr:LysE family transporter [Chloroflexaceae bacterium]